MKYRPAIPALAGWLFLSACLTGRAAAAVCSQNILVDDYSKFASHTNSLGGYTGDDGSTIALKADNAAKKVSFTARADTTSYFYTTLAPPSACFNATDGNYTALEFPIKGPVGGSFTLELQVSTLSATGMCESGGSAYKSTYYLVTGMTGQTKTVRVSLKSAFGLSAEELGRVRAVVWQDLEGGDWEIGKTIFICGAQESAKLRRESERRDQCTDLLIDDWNSQSRLTFLYYNAMLEPSSDDGTMKSVVVSNNHVTYDPKDVGSSYWYTQFPCVSATGKYGGIGANIKAPAGTTFSIELQTSASCDSNNPVSRIKTTKDLGWTFDGTEKYYAIPFSKYDGLDMEHITGMVVSQLTHPITLGPLAFYCGTGAGSPFKFTPNKRVDDPAGTVGATTGPADIVIDKFTNPDSNEMGLYHGGDDSNTYKISGGKITFSTVANADLSWYTQVSSGCTDFTPNDNSYLHIAYTGSSAFSIAMQQHNNDCNDQISPYPYTWDDVEASRYSNTAKTDIYVPLTHFKIDRTKTIGFSLKGFYTKDTTTVSVIEIVKTVPSGFLVPSKLETAPLVFSCTRPNSFAFAIDDGTPEFAQKVLSTIRDAGIKVTFFTVGAGLLDPTTNFTNVYKEMLGAGHQVAYHSYTHPPMEGLPDLASIDWEIQEDIAAVDKSLGIKSKYFRPPFGTEGARLRQRLAALIPGVKLINWSVDVADWQWAQSNTPEKQLDAFKSDVAKGGNLVVMHYLYESTVNYLPEFIKLAKDTGKQLMRVDQCLEDPDAPPL